MASTTEFTNDSTNVSVFTTKLPVRGNTVNPVAPVLNAGGDGCPNKAVLINWFVFDEVVVPIPNKVG